MHRNRSSPEGRTPTGVTNTRRKSSWYVYPAVTSNYKLESLQLLLQWYLEHHGEDDPLIDPGLKRDTPLDGTLIGKKGLALATRYLKWAGRNFPGYVGIRHAATLVRLSGKCFCVYKLFSCASQHSPGCSSCQHFGLTICMFDVWLSTHCSVMTSCSV